MDFIYKNAVNAHPIKNPYMLNAEKGHKQQGEGVIMKVEPLVGCIS